MSCRLSTQKKADGLLCWTYFTVTISAHSSKHTQIVQITILTAKTFTLMHIDTYVQTREACFLPVDMQIFCLCKGEQAPGLSCLFAFYCEHECMLIVV